MRPPADHSAEVLFLRKTPYQDNACIVTGLSSELGRMVFYLRLPAPGSRKNSTFFDLFQLVQVEYRQSSSEMCFCQNGTVLADYTAVANNRNGFETACLLAQFALANVPPQLAMPKFFQALRVALIRLQTPNDIDTNGVLTGVALTYLNEAGWLSPLEMAPAEAAQCELLLRMAAGGDIPALAPQVWNALRQWTQSRLLDADCKEIHWE